MLGLVLAVLAGTAGCASVKSSFLERDPADAAWAPASGPIDGVPVTLEVPSHVKVQFVRRYHYATPAPGKDPVQLTTAGPDGKPIPLVTYDFTHEIIEEKKVVLVDFKRPATGKFDFKADINKDTGYFTQVRHQGNDRTIETVGNEVNDLVATIARVQAPPHVQPAPQNAPAQPATPGVTPPPAAAAAPIETVLATVFIKVTDPDFERQLRDFVCCSLASAGLPACGCEVPPAPVK
jgi:hypothetical protein